MKFLSAFRFLCVAVGVMTLLSACRTSSTSVTQTDAVPVVRLSDEDQRRFDYYFLEATRLKLRGDYAPAYEMIRHCLAIHPQSSSALYEQAQYLLMLKQEEKATRSLEAAVRLAPDNYWYSQALCNFYLQSNDTTGKARRLLESMSIRFPNKPDVLYTLMGLYNRNGEYSRVIDVLNRLEQKLGKSEQLSMEKFRMYLQLQDMKNAFREMESLVAEYPKDPRYKVVLGDIYLENKKPEQAYRLYQEALTDEPDNALALYSLANYYDEMGMEEQYKHQLDTLLMNRKVPAATKTEVMRRIVVQSEKEQADSTKVINLFERVLQQEPDDVSLPMLYAQYLYTKGMKKEMIPVLNRVIDIDPGNTSARSNLIAEAVKAEDYHEIIRLCETGVEVNPERIDF